MAAIAVPMPAIGARVRVAPSTSGYGLFAGRRGKVVKAPDGWTPIPHMAWVDLEEVPVPLTFAVRNLEVEGRDA